MTSNIGARWKISRLWSAVSEIWLWSYAQTLSLEELKKNRFRPEFINRGTDGNYCLPRPGQRPLHEIVRLLADGLIDRMAELDIDLKITSAAVDVITEEGYNQNTVQDRLNELCKPTLKTA